MNMVKRLYESIYKRIGGRPWTEIIRDDQVNAPLGYMLIFMALGILVVKLCGKYWWWSVTGFLLGVLVGHFWW